MGPASLSENYAVDGAGVVTADFTFTAGKARYTQDEVLALRAAVLEQNKADAIIVTFDQTGAKQLAAGKTREALEVDRALIAGHPKEAVHHVRMAYALLQAGVGDEARAEARKAVEVDPKSALAWSTLAWVLEFNSIGVQHGSGFDLNGGLDAFRKAKELDPDNMDHRVNLAILYEYDAIGSRYAADAALDKAIEEYQALKKQDKETGERYEDNLLFCLLYARRYKELLTEVAGLPSSAVRSGLSIAATAASEGVEAGIRRADQVSGDTGQRSEALTKAGEELIWLRLYPEAAQILTAGLQGQTSAAYLARQVEIFRNLRPYDAKQTTEGDATGVVRRMMADMMSGNLTEREVSQWLGRHAYANEEQWKKNLKKSEDAAGSLRVVADRAGTTLDVIRDTALGAMKVSTQGDDGAGYRITVQTVGAAPQQFFVTKEDGAYKIVASNEDVLEVGNEALYLLHHGNEQEARSLLDWKRDQMHKGGGDDPLSGPLLPRFWTSGETKGAEAIELAAASLMAGGMDIAAMLPGLVEKGAAAGVDKSDPAAMDLLLAEGYLHAEDSAHAKPAIDALLAGWPDSYTALGLAGEADRLTKNWAAWNARLDAHLAKHPTDRILLLEKSEAEQAQGDFAAARKTLKQVLSGGEANAEDYNNYAWNALFEHNVDEDAIQAGQQATTLTNNGRFADLHTLACLYAAQGKTTEARQVLLQAMESENLAEPNSPAWFAFGAIYEQYGDRDAAIAAFRKVEKPEGPMSPADTYVLAQEHLKAEQQGTGNRE
jgi:tetratricopeptide (TPR) repeat protein